ncbi:MAG: hypothetical protein ABI707_18750 [Ferruginibacter sp.]
MKNLILISLIFLSSIVSYSQSVGISIDGSVPDPSAMLDVKSTTKGLLIPRMSSAERTGILNPAVGLLVYDDETASFWYYKAAGWSELVTGAGGGSWNTNGADIYNNNAGNVGIGVNAPLAPFHIKKDNEAFRIQGATPYISFYDNAGAYKGFIQNFNNNLLFGTPASNPNSKLEFYNGNIKNLSLDGFGTMDLSGSNPFLSLNSNGTRSGYLYGTGTTMEIAAYKGAKASAGNLILQVNETGISQSGQPATLYAGNVGIGTRTPVEKLTVQTSNNSYGISHRSVEGNILATLIGGTSAGIGTFSNTNMRIFANGVSAIFIGSGTNNVGIGKEYPTYKLEVNGTIRSKEVIVESNGWPDYVFDEKYKLSSIDEVEKYIEQNKHLPNIPSAKEIEEKGLHLGDTQKKIMEKIEEMTLYIIEANKKIQQLEKIIRQRK